MHVCESPYVSVQSMASLHWHSSWPFLESCLESHPAAPKSSAKWKSWMLWPPSCHSYLAVLSVLQHLDRTEKRWLGFFFVHSRWGKEKSFELGCPRFVWVQTLWVHWSIVNSWNRNRMQVWWTIIIKQLLLCIQPVYSFLVSLRYRCWFHVLGSPPHP